MCTVGIGVFVSKLASTIFIDVQQTASTASKALFLVMGTNTMSEEVIADANRSVIQKPFRKYKKLQTIPKTIGPHKITKITYFLFLSGMTLAE